VIRIGPNKLSFRSAAALKDIYGDTTSLVKPDDFYSAFSAIPGKYNTHNSISKAEHARKRRVLSHAFSETALKVMEDLIIKYVDYFCGYLQSVPGPKDMAKWYNYLTYDVMEGKNSQNHQVFHKADTIIS
jgi:cytochrome P450